MKEYLLNKKLTINIRPVQFCYFYRKGNKKELKKILQLVSTQWGGIYNLIIPILANGKTYASYEHSLEIHTPDIFVSALDNELNKKLTKYLQRIVPKRKIEIGSFESFIKFDDSAHPLGFIAEDMKLNFYLLCPKVNFKKNRDLLQLALFGEIYPDQIQDYTNILSVQDYKNIDTNDQIIISQFWITPHDSPINFTSINIKPYSILNPSFADSDIIDLVVGDDENAIVYYWNLRALREKSQINKSNEFGRRVLLMPLKFLRDIDLFKRFFMEIKRSFRGGYQNSNLNICIDHIPKKQIKSLHKNGSVIFHKH